MDPNPNPADIPVQTLRLEPGTDVATNSDGAAASHADRWPAARPDSAPLASQDLFWQAPPRDGTWLDAPLPVRGHAHEDTSGLVARLEDLIREDAPHRAWLLKWTYETGARAAEAELEDVEAHARRLGIEALEENLARSEEAFAAAASAAGIACDAATASPAAVEEAVRRSTPTLEEMAGQHGLIPAKDAPPARRGLGAALGRAFSALGRVALLVLPALVCGLLVALCLGALVGLVDLPMLSKLDENAGRLGLAALLGFVIVFLMGEIVAAAVGTVARASEEATPGEMDAPRLRRAPVMAGALLTVALLLAAAEVTAEANGLHLLYKQEQYRQRHLSVQNAADNRPDIPMFVFYLIGTLISGPYLVSKAGKAWKGAEEEQRLAWLKFRRKEMVDARLQDDRIQKAYRLAGETAALRGRLEAIRGRRDAARTAAAGEAARFHSMARGIVESREPDRR